MTTMTQETEGTSCAELMVSDLHMPFIKALEKKHGVHIDEMQVTSHTDHQYVPGEWGEREYTQNLFDALKHQGIPYDISTTRNEPDDEDWHTIRVFHSSEDESTLATITHTAEKITYVQHNTATFPRESLLLCSLNKGESDESLGGYGEGFKIATLLLLKRGYSVTFEHQSETWYFFLAPVSKTSLVRAMYVAIHHRTGRADDTLTISLVPGNDTEYHKGLLSDKTCMQLNATYEDGAGVLFEGFIGSHDLPCKGKLLTRAEHDVDTCSVYSGGLFVQASTEILMPIDVRATARKHMTRDRTGFSVSRCAIRCSSSLLKSAVRNDVDCVIFRILEHTLFTASRSWKQDITLLFNSNVIRRHLRNYLFDLDKRWKFCEQLEDFRSGHFLTCLVKLNDGEFIFLHQEPTTEEKRQLKILNLQYLVHGNALEFDQAMDIQKKFITLILNGPSVPIKSDKFSALLTFLELWSDNIPFSPINLKMLTDLEKFSNTVVTSVIKDASSTTMTENIYLDSRFVELAEDDPEHEALQAVGFTIWELIPQGKDVSVKFMKKELIKFMQRPVTYVPGVLNKFILQEKRNELVFGGKASGKHRPSNKRKAQTSTSSTSSCHKRQKSAQKASRHAARPPSQASNRCGINYAARVAEGFRKVASRSKGTGIQTRAEQTSGQSQDSHGTCTVMPACAQEPTIGLWSNVGSEIPAAAFVEASLEIPKYLDIRFGPFFADLEFELHFGWFESSLQAFMAPDKGQIFINLASRADNDDDRIERLCHEIAHIQVSGHNAEHGTACMQVMREAIRARMRAKFTKEREDDGSDTEIDDDSEDEMSQSY